MSRSQQSEVLKTAESNSSADQTAATKAQAAENADIGNYEAQLSKYAAENPYVDGGEYQTSQNKALSGTADAGSAAITNQLQTQAKRTGENAGAATATAAEAARANMRDLSALEGKANAERMADEAGYNQGVVNASEFPAQLEQNQYATGVGAANQALNTGANAAQTPSFWDTLGSSFATQLGKTAAGGNAGGGGSSTAQFFGACWIAAELYGGWNDPRTIDVRRWLFTDFVKSWYGEIICTIYEWQGERVAGWIHRWPVLRRIFLPLFNKALNKARGQ